MECVVVRVYGKVQGVGFRFFVYRYAKRLQLKGYVRNLKDGSVEIWAEGKEKNINKLLDVVKVGPLLAKVEDIKVVPCNPIGYKNFEILVG